MFGQKNTRNTKRCTSVQTCVSVAWRLATDASIVAMGAVSHYDDDYIEHPIGYYSRKLIDTKRAGQSGNWSWVQLYGRLHFTGRTFAEFISSW